MPRLRAIHMFFAAFVFFTTAAAAQAAYVAPPNDSNEAGGAHFRFISKDEGPVHVWYPANFDAATAKTIIHVHGYHKYDGPGGDAPPPYAIDYKEHLDYVWDGHDLAKKFAGSGINALFIVPDALKGDGVGNRWKSLPALLAEVKAKTGIEPPGQVFALAHSGGVFTINYWLDDPKLVGLIMLDSLYSPLGDLNEWINKDGHRIAVVPSKSGGATYTKDFRTTYTHAPPRVVVVNEFPTALTEEQRAAKIFLISKQSKYTHMNLVDKDEPMSILLAFFGGSGSSGGGAGSEDGGGILSDDAGGNLTISDNAGYQLNSPRLEVEIPGLDLTAPYRQGSDVVAPYLSQYITAVYNFLIAIVGIVAAVVMMHGGFLYMTSGGSADRAGKGRQKIQNAMIGLILTFGSYTILYTINPALVNFSGFQLISVSSVLYNSDRQNALNEEGVIEASEDGDGTPPKAGSAVYPTFPNGKNPSNVCHRSGKGGKPRLCSELCAMSLDKTITDDDSGKEVKVSSQWPDSTPGMANPLFMVKISGLDGVSSSQRTDPTTYALLKRAGEIASDTSELQKIGVSGGPYVINVTSGYRPLWKQIQLACDSENGEGSNIGGTLAAPGSSFHGAGFALDIALKKNGSVVSRSGNSQAQQYPKWRDGSIKLAKIMIAAGFRRLKNEIWHFEPAEAPDPGCRCYKMSECPFPAKFNDAFHKSVQALEAKVAAETDPKARKTLEGELKALLGVNSSTSPVGCKKKGNYDNE